MNQHTTDEQHQRDKQFLIECLTADLARLLIEEYGYSMEEPLTLYIAHTPMRSWSANLQGYTLKVPFTSWSF